jgi:hypothetical protein
MNRKEWLKSPKELRGWENYTIAKNELWFGMINKMKQERPGVKIVLHHINVNDQHYENWCPVVPMYNDEHLKLHGKGIHRTKEVREKISNSLKGKSGKIPGIETRLKMSESHKGRIVSFDTRKKLSEANKGKEGSNLGKKFSEEHRKKISESNKGKKRSIETCNNIGKSKRGRKCSEDTKIKMSLIKKGKKPNNIGQHWFTNGKENIMALECPYGFYKGRKVA